MKKIFLLAMLASAVAACSSHKNNIAAAPSLPDMEAYVMVYHKDCDHSLHMAVSDDGYNWSAVKNDEAVIWGDTIAMQHGIRDPHIFRGPDGGFYLAMTDLHIFSQQKYADDPTYRPISEYRDSQWDRPDKYGWGNNKGLVLMKSYDLVNWSRTNIDLTELTCPTGLTDADGNPLPWSEMGCAWAPETVYDYQAGKIMVHFTTRFATGGSAGYNRIFYAYLNDDFTALDSDPKLLFQAPVDDNGQPRYNVIDSDICFVNGVYHMFYVSHEHTATVKHAVSNTITGPYTIDPDFTDGETRGHEAPNCWQRIGTDRWVMMFDNYRMNPHNFGFVETTDFKTFTPIGYFDNGVMTRTNFAEQKHGAVAPITAAEAARLRGLK